MWPSQGRDEGSIPFTRSNKIKGFITSTGFSYVLVTSLPTIAWQIRFSGLLMGLSSIFGDFHDQTVETRQTDVDMI